MAHEYPGNLFYVQVYQQNGSQKLCSTHKIKHALLSRTFLHCYNPSVDYFIHTAYNLYIASFSRYSRYSATEHISTEYKYCLDLYEFMAKIWYYIINRKIAISTLIATQYKELCDRICAYWRMDTPIKR